MEKKRITLGHSPDADDAFMFYALAEGRIDSGHYTFEHIVEDIQQLNDRATRGELDVTAVSIHAYAYILKNYALLPCGASMGDGYGPILVARSRGDLAQDAGEKEVRQWIAGKKVAIPGKLTSAYLALRLFDGDGEVEVVRFDQIFQAVQEGRCDVGLIIHEGQLSWEEAGLQLLLDLGAWWKHETGLPLPLGANVIRKNIDHEERVEIGRIIKESIRYGIDHPEEALEYSLTFARGMDAPLVERFVKMYVNDFTLDYGEKGRKAIREFLGQASENGFIPAPVELEFVEA